MQQRSLFRRQIKKGSRDDDDGSRVCKANRDTRARSEGRTVLANREASMRRMLVKNRNKKRLLLPTPLMSEADVLGSGSGLLLLQQPLQRLASASTSLACLPSFPSRLPP